MKIEITSTAKEAVRKVREFPNKLRAVIMQEMDKQNSLAIGSTTRTRLTGKGPFPVSEHRLGVVTARLRKSLNATKAFAHGGSIISSIRTNVEYAGAHEFGFEGSIFINSHTRRAHKRKRWVGIKRKKHSVRETIVSGHGRNVSIPARAPIKHGLEDYREEYGKGISRAIVEAWEKHVRTL